jgi:lipopolysaccharide transport system permease protein
MRTLRLLAQSLIRHRSIWWQFTLRYVEIRNKGSHLGLLWSVLNPLIMLALYVLVFGYIYGGRFGVLPNETKTEYGLGIFLGLALYNFVSDLLCSSPVSISDNTNFVKKVVFPLEVLPAALVGSAFVHLLITLGLVAIGVVFFGPGLSLSCLWLVVVLIPVIMWAMGIAWAVSALSVFLQDIRQLLPAMATGLMFASAVFYPPSKIPAAVWTVLKYNPLIHAIEGARAVMLWGQPLNWHAMLYLYGTGALAMLCGFWIFMKLKPAFADVL